MLTVLRQRHFAVLWFGQLISTIGDWVLLIALPFYVYQLTGSALATGTMFIVETLPRIAFASLVGVLVDRWDRRHLMIISDIVRASILLVILIVPSTHLLWVIYLIAFIQSFVGLFFDPARSALVPTIVGEEQLIAANALDSVSDSLTRLIGPSLGGILLGLLGISSVVFVDSASFLVSAVMITLIKLPKKQAAESEEQHESSVSARSALTTFWGEWLAGLKLLKGERVMTALFVVMSIMMLGQGIINALLPVFVKVTLHSEAIVYGWTATAQGIGMLCGAALLGQMRKFFQPAHLILLGIGVPGLFFLLIVNMPLVPLDLSLIILGSLCIPCFFVGSQTLLQSSIADEYRGRIFGAFGTTSSLMLLVGLSVGGTLGNRFGVIALLESAGVLYFLAGVVALVMIREKSRREENE